MTWKRPVRSSGSEMASVSNLEAFSGFGGAETTGSSTRSARRSPIESNGPPTPFIPAEIKSQSLLIRILQIFVPRMLLSICLRGFWFRVIWHFRIVRLQWGVYQRYIIIIIFFFFKINVILSKSRFSCYFHVYSIVPLFIFTFTEN